MATNAGVSERRRLEDNMDFVPVATAAVTGLFGIVGIIVTHYLTKSRTERKERANVARGGSDGEPLRPERGNTPFGSEVIKRVEKIERALLGAETVHDPIFSEAAQHKLDNCLAEVSDIADGTIKVEEPVELANIPNALSERMKSLLATSLWAIDPSRGVLRKQFLAIQAGRIREHNATVQRLFLIDERTLEAHNDAFIERMQADVQDGVKVRWMLDSEWVASDSAPRPIDFGIWDGELVWLYDRHTDHENRVWLAYVKRSEHEVTKHTQIFRANWSIARPPHSARVQKGSAAATG